MTGKRQGPPKGMPWIWLTLDLMGSEAWRSLTISARRLLDFLMIEHMQHGGKENGGLLAPRRQLEAFGISSHLVSEAITEVETLGFVDVRRGEGRRPSTYALTWLPTGDGAEPSNRWRSVTTAEEQSQEMTADQQHHMLQNSSHKGSSDCRSAVAKGRSDCSSRTADLQHISRRRSYQGRGNNKALTGRRGGA